MRPVTYRIGIVFMAFGGMSLGGCAAFHNGYPNRATAPNLAEPSKPATDNKGMYLDLIRQMQQQGAYYASLAHIDAFRLRYGNPPELQRLQAEALRETGQNDAASKVYQGMLHNEEAGPAWHGLGLIAASDKRYSEAEKDLLQATHIEPVNVTYLNDLGYARLAAGDVASAHEPLAEAAELEPTNAKVISNLALWASLRGDDSQAEAIMQRANLPAATREVVRKMALQLRTQARFDAEADPIPPSANDKAALATPAQGIPSSLLDHFSSASSSEAHP
jgi:Flp pilus assembly protein TadD